MSVAGHCKVSHLSNNADLSLGDNDGENCFNVDCLVGSNSWDCIDVDNDSPLGSCGNFIDDDCPVDVSDVDCVDADFPMGGDRDGLDVDLSLCNSNGGVSVVDCSVGNSGKDFFSIDVDFPLGGKGGGISVNVDCPVRSDDDASFSVGIDFPSCGTGFCVNVDFFFRRKRWWGSC